MSFPTVMTWCVGTMLSLVATMTRRSGSGTAGDRHGLWVVEAQEPGSCVLFLSLAVELWRVPQGREAVVASLCWAWSLEGSAMGPVPP